MATFFHAMDGTVAENAPAAKLPDALAKKAASPCKTSEQILAKNARAEEARAGVLQERVAQAQAEDAKVAQAQALKQEFNATGMEILGAGEKVVLPGALQARLASLPAKASAAANLEKEQRAHAAREEQLAAKVAQAQTEDAKVAQAQALKKEFAETGMEIMGAGEKVALPGALQARLDGLPAKASPEANLEKEQRAHAAREEQLAAKVAQAQAHGAQGEEVRARKRQFDEVGITWGDKPVREAPAAVQARLKAVGQRAPEDAVAENEKHAAKRAEQLAAKVAQAQAHNAVVQERMAAKKEKKAEEEAAAAATAMEE